MCRTRIQLLHTFVVILLLIYRPTANCLGIKFQHIIFTLKSITVNSLSNGAGFHRQRTSTDAKVSVPRCAVLIMFVERLHGCKEP